MEKKPLTAVQQKVLEAIKSLISEGTLPSYREIAIRAGYGDTTGVRWTLQILERKGYIARQEGRHRSIQVL